ncbi:MAG: lysophospholipase [Alphaproteobacteria bacterium]|nr:lysophospholipase [Alphaproteobacteria bacterium]
MKFRTLLFAAALTGCAAVTAPPGPGPATPALAPDSFTARDGMVLPLRHWGPLEHPRAIIVALHGMSDYSNGFAMPGAEWAKANILTLAYDQRGFGAAPNPGLWAGADVMRDDLRDAVAAAHRRWPGIPVFALGESMGGAVVLTALEQPGSIAPAKCEGRYAGASDRVSACDQQKLDVTGAILVAPAVWSRADMPLSYRVALFLAAHFLPGLILSNSAASHVVTVIPSDNIEMLRAMARDPLVQHETRADAVFGLTNLMDEARTAPSRITNSKDGSGAPPILFTYGARDQVIPPAPTTAVIALLGPRAEVHRYDNGYHMLLRDLDRAAPQRDIAAWISARATENRP